MREDGVGMGCGGVGWGWDGVGWGGDGMCGDGAEMSGLLLGIGWGWDRGDGVGMGCVGMGWECPACWFAARSNRDALLGISAISALACCSLNTCSAYIKRME